MQISAHATPSTSPGSDSVRAQPPRGVPPAPGNLELESLRGLEARMEAAKRHMDARLAVAAVAYEVNTAHIDTEHVGREHIDIAPAGMPAADRSRVTAAPPFLPEPARIPVPGVYGTPVAALLHRATLRLREAGWCAGALVDEEGALCSQGAIRKESGGDRRLEARAMEVLLETIRRKFGPSVESVPTFNDAWADGREPTRMMEQASVLADGRGI